MAEISSMMPLGTKAPDFDLLETQTDKMISLAEIKSNVATVIMFICNHCPYVKHIEPRLIQIAKEYQARGILFIAISSNDVATYPEDGPDKMKIHAMEKAYPFAYLYDETQAVAKAYQAVCTPDFFVFDHDLKCVYRGRFDDATPRNGVVPTGSELCAALDAVLMKQPVSEDQKASIGCGIKWK